MLKTSGCGFGHLALAGLLGQGAKASSLPRSNLEKLPHYKPRAKRIIFLFMCGGPSHVDLFDPKPLLKQRAGSQLQGADLGVKRGAMGELLG